MRIIIPIACLLAIAVTGPCRASEASPPPPPPLGERKGPPPFDPALCQSKAPGTPLETKTPDGRTLRGKCQLVFLPDPPDRPDRHVGPPSTNKP